MSKVIDEKVVSLQFDNKNFENNVKESMSTLDKLKQSLNFNKAAKSFDELTEASNRVSFKGIEKSMDKLESYMSVKTMAIFTVVNNMVTKIQNSFENMIKTFTVEPIRTGFNEYELKMGSVQTIMAATGASLQEVNGYLQELNLYADKTIYSFSDMTTNIGKFTNAGVKLEDAVLAIKGISNEAAISGANAQEASRAMYNLAQSISMGYVQLIDWKSIENANMATKEFKENLAGVALDLGLIKRNSEGIYTVGGKNYNLQQLFKDGLKEQWLTTDVLIKTLSNYADETTEIGKKAYAAAQDVKTFTMMMDTLKEAAQSGWAQTWELIVGDFEQAKKLFTYFSDIFGGIIEKAADVRNSIVQSTMETYWDKITRKVGEAGINVEAFEAQIIDSFKKAGVPIEEMIEKWGSLGNALAHMKGWADVIKKYVLEALNKLSGGINTVGDAAEAMMQPLEKFQDLVNRTIRGEFGNGKKRIEELTKLGENAAVVQKLVNKVWEKNNHTWKDTTITQEELVSVMGELSDAELVAMGIDEDRIDSVRALVKAIEAGEGEIGDLFAKVTELRGRELLFESLKNIITAISQRVTILKEAWHEVFPVDMAALLDKINSAFYNLSRKLILNSDKADKLKRALKGVFSIFGIITDGLRALIRVLFPALDKGADLASDSLLDILATLGDGIVAFRELINNEDLFVGFMKNVVSMFVAGCAAIAEFVKYLWNLEEVQEVLHALGLYFADVITWWETLWDGFLEDLADPALGIFGALKNAFKKIGNAIKSFLLSLPLVSKAVEFIQGIPELIGEAGWNTIMGFISGVWDAMKAIPKVMAEFVSLVVDTVLKLFDIRSPSHVFERIAYYVVLGFVEGIKTLSSLVFKVINWEMTGIINIVSELSDRLIEWWSKSVFKEYIDSTIAWFKNALKNIYEFLKPYLDIVAEMFVKFYNKMKEIGWSTILGYLKQLFEIVLLYKIISGWQSAGKGLEKLGRSMEMFAKSIKRISSGIKLAGIGVMLIGFAIALGAIVGIIYLLSRLPMDNLGYAVTCVTVIASILLALMLVFGTIAMKGGDKVKNALDSTKGLILSIAGLVLSFVGAIMLLTWAVFKLSSMLGEDNGIEQFSLAVNALNMLAWFMIKFVGALALISWISKSSDGGILKGAGIAVLGLALSIVLIIKIIDKYLLDEDGQLDETKADAINKGFQSIKSIVWNMAACLALIGLATRGGSSAKGLALTVIAMSASLFIIITAIGYFDMLVSSMNDPTGSIATILIIMGVLMGGLALIGFSLKAVDPKAISKVTTLMIVILAQIVALIVMFAVLKNASIDSDATIIIGIIMAVEAIMGAIIAFISMMTKDILETKGADEAEKFVNMVGKLVKSIALFMGIFAFSVAGMVVSLMLLDKKTLTTQHVVAIISLVVGMVGAIAALIVYLSIVQNKLPKPKKLFGVVATIAGFIAVLALSFAGIIFSLTLLDKKDIDSDVLGPIIAAVVMVVGSLVALLIYLGKVSHTAAQATALSKVVEALDSFILALTLSIMGIALSIKFMENVSLTTGAIVSFIVAIVAIVFAVIQVMKFIASTSFNAKQAKSIFKIIGAIDLFMLAFSASILMIAGAIVMMKNVKLEIATTLTFIGTILLLLLAVMGVMHEINKMGNNVKADKVFTILLAIDIFMAFLAACVVGIAYGLTLIDGVDIKWSTCVALIAVVAALVLAIIVLTKSIMAAGANLPTAGRIIALLGGLALVAGVVAVSTAVVAEAIVKASKTDLTTEAIFVVLGILVGLMLAIGLLMKELMTLPPQAGWEKNIIALVVAAGVVGIMSWVFTKIAEEFSLIENLDYAAFAEVLVLGFGVIALLYLLCVKLGNQMTLVAGLVNAGIFLAIGKAIQWICEGLTTLASVGNVDAINAAAEAVEGIVGILAIAAVVLAIVAKGASPWSTAIVGGFAVIMFGAALLAKYLAILGEMGDKVIQFFKDLNDMANEHNPVHDTIWNIMGEIERWYDKWSNGDLPRFMYPMFMPTPYDTSEIEQQGAEDAENARNAYTAGVQSEYGQLSDEQKAGWDFLNWITGGKAENWATSGEKKSLEDSAEKAGEEAREIQMEGFTTGFATPKGDTLPNPNDLKPKLPNANLKGKKPSFSNKEDELFGNAEESWLVASNGEGLFGKIRNFPSEVKKDVENKAKDWLVNEAKTFMEDSELMGTFKEYGSELAGQIGGAFGLGTSEGLSDGLSGVSDMMPEEYSKVFDQYLGANGEGGFNQEALVKKVKEYMPNTDDDEIVGAFTELFGGVSGATSGSIEKAAEFSRDELVQHMSDALEVYLGESDLIGRVKTDLISSGKLKSTNTSDLMSYIANETFKELDSKGIKFNEANKDKIAKVIMDTILPQTFTVDAAKFKENITEAVSAATEGLAEDNGFTGLWNGVINGANVNACVQSTIEWPDLLQTNDVATQGAINSLKTEVTALGVRIANLSVQLDSGVLVGQLTPKISETLGKQAILAGRVNFTNPFMTGR